MSANSVPGAREERALYAKMEADQNVQFDSVGKGIEWLRNRLSIPKAAMRDAEREGITNAFTLAGDLSEATLDRIKESLAQAQARGDNLEAWRGALDQILGDGGFAAARSELIFRQESQNAQQAGMREELQDPDYQDWIVGYEYITMDDDRVRETHAAMHGVIFRADDPAVDVWWPPNGFNCRCVLLPIDKLEAKRGVEFTDPLPDVEPDQGFDKPPGGRLAR